MSKDTKLQVNIKMELKEKEHWARLAETNGLTMIDMLRCAVTLFEAVKKGILIPADVEIPVKTDGRKMLPTHTDIQQDGIQVQERVKKDGTTQIESNRKSIDKNTGIEVTSDTVKHQATQLAKKKRPFWSNLDKTYPGRKM